MNVLFIFMVLGLMGGFCDLSAMNHRPYNNPHFTQVQNDFMNGKCSYADYRPSIKLSCQLLRNYDPRIFKWFSNKAEELFDEKDFEMHAYTLDVDSLVETYGARWNYVDKNENKKINKFLYAKFIFDNSLVKYMVISVARAFVHIDGKYEKPRNVIYHRGAKEMQANQSCFEQLVKRKINIDIYDEHLGCTIELYIPN